MMAQQRVSASGRASARVPGRLDERTERRIAVGGSILGALAMSSCCILPLALFSVGVTGAWIGNLAAFYPYRPYILVVTAVFLGLGFYRAYRTPGAQACGVAGQCGTPFSLKLTRSALWLSLAIVLAALAFPYYAPLLLET